MSSIRDLDDVQRFSPVFEPSCTVFALELARPSYGLRAAACCNVVPISRSHQGSWRQLPERSTALLALFIVLALVELVMACRMWFTLLALQQQHRRHGVRLLTVEDKVKSLRKART